MLVNMMNYISRDNIFGRLSELIKELLEWTNKVLLGTVIGLNAIKGLISPMLDSLKGTAITRLVGMIPGAGTAVDAVTGVILGSGALIKNSMGVAAMLVIIMLCAIPVIKLLDVYKRQAGGFCASFLSLELLRSFCTDRLVN